MLTIFNIFKQLKSLSITDNIIYPHTQTFFPNEFFSKYPISGAGEYTFMIITVGLFILMIIFFIYKVFQTYSIQKKNIDKFDYIGNGKKRSKTKPVIDKNDKKSDPWGRIPND